MGKCIKCGRETANCYSYLLTDNVRIKRGVDLTVTSHSAFLCTRCVKRRGAILAVVSGCVSFLITALVVYAAAIGNPTATVGVIAGFFLIASLTLVCGIVLCGWVRKDKKLSESELDKFLMNIVMNDKSNRGKRYFPPSDYEWLQNRIAKKEQ